MAMAARILVRMLSRPPDPPTPLSSRGTYLGWHAAMAMARTTLIQLRMRPSRARWDPWTRPISRPDDQDSDHCSTSKMRRSNKMMKACPASSRSRGRVGGFRREWVGEVTISLPRDLKPRLPCLRQRLHRLPQSVDPGELLL